MPDRISNYRQVRLVINPSPFADRPARWSLNAVVVRKGVPYASAVESGSVEGLDQNCSEEEIWAAILWIVLRNYSPPSD